MTVEELYRIKQRVLERKQEESQSIARIVVCLDTGGIAAGAEEVLRTAEEEATRCTQPRAKVVRTGSFGVSSLDPLVMVQMPNDEPVAYVKMTPDKMRHVIQRHVIEGQIVQEYTVHVANNIMLNDYTVME